MPDREDEVLLNELIDAHAAATGRPTDLGLTTWASRARALETESARLRAALHRIRDRGPGRTREWCVREAAAALAVGEAPAD
jgi:hypothetical protein